MTIYDRLNELGFSHHEGKYIKKLSARGMIINGIPQPIQYMVEIESLSGGYEITPNEEKIPMESIYVRIYQGDKLVNESNHLIGLYDIKWLNHILSNL